MPSLSLVKINTVSKRPQAYPSKRQRGLWRLVSPAEPMVEPSSPLDAQPIWYQSSDGFVGSVFHIAPVYFGNKSPVVILLGPLLHPRTVLSRTQPWIQSLLEEGHPVYAISHRSHHHQTSDLQDTHDTSFNTIVVEDIINALESINSHSGSSRLHLIGQDLGSLLALHLMGCIDSNRFESIHLFNLPYRFPKSFKTMFLSYIHQNTSVRQVWDKHLHTGLLPEIAQKLSLIERSALLFSDSWLAKDWIRTLRQHPCIESMSFSPNILLLKALPSTLSCPVHMYTSSTSDSLVHSPLAEMKNWTVHSHSLPPSIFPLLTFNNTLSIP